MVEHKPIIETLPVERALMTPVLAGMYDYWSALPAAPGGIPVWGGALGEGFRLIDLPSDLLQVMVIVDAGPTDRDFVYRYWGSERRLFLGGKGDPTGTPLVHSLKEANVREVLGQYKDVCNGGRPVLVHNTWPLENGLSAECQSLRLPLTDGRGGVDKVAAATVFIRHADLFRRMREAVD